MSDETRSTEMQLRMLLRVFACFAFAYFMSFALRAVQAAIAPLLSAEFALSASDLGLLSSAYFVAFAALQIPLGMWLDRYGARRVEATLLLAASAGIGAFALAASTGGLFAARALIGAGFASCLMAPMVFYRRWCPLELQGTLNMWMLVAGTLGALAATAPAVWLAGLIGWRGLFWVCAGLALTAATVVRFSIPARFDVPAVSPAQPRERQWPVYAHLMRHPVLIRSAPLGALVQGGAMALQTLWAGPWMTNVLGMSPMQAASTLFLYNLAGLGAYVGFGLLTRRLQAAGATLPQIFVPGFVWIIAMLVAIVAWTAPASWILWPMLALGVPCTVLLQTSIALSFPGEVAGRASTAFNLVSFTGAFALQWGLGLAVDGFALMGASAVDSFRLAFGTLALGQMIALAWYLARR